MPFDSRGFLGEQIISISKEIEEENRYIFDLCYELNELAERTKFKFIIHTDNGQEVLGASLFVKILQGFQATLVLFRMGLGAEGKILTRVILESLFILKAICKDEKLVEDFVLTDQAKQQRLLGLILEKSNEDIFHGIKDIHDAEKFEKLKKENIEKGIRDISAQDWARKAELTSHYETAYRVLSDTSIPLPDH